MNYIEDDDQPQNKPNLIGALGNLLSTNTDQRNMALAELNGARQQLQKAKQSKHDLAFELYGRLIKYEPTIFEEVKNYVMNNDVFYATTSDKLNIYSKIDDYTTANGKKTFKAHYTIYGHYIKKCETEEDKPISYNGRFLMKKYIDLFIFNKWATEYKKVEDFFIPLKDEPVECDACKKWVKSLPYIHGDIGMCEDCMVKHDEDMNCQECWNDKPLDKSNCDKCQVRIKDINYGGASKEQNYLLCNDCYDPETVQKLKPFPRNECDKCHIQVLGNNAKNGGGACKEQNYIYCGNCYITEISAKMSGYEPTIFDTPVVKPKRKYTRKPKV